MHLPPEWGAVVVLLLADSLFARVLIFLTRLCRQLSDHGLYSCGQKFGQISLGICLTQLLAQNNLISAKKNIFDHALYSCGQTFGQTSPGKNLTQPRSTHLDDYSHNNAPVSKQSNFSQEKIYLKKKENYLRKKIRSAIWGLCGSLLVIWLPSDCGSIHSRFSDLPRCHSHYH